MRCPACAVPLQPEDLIEKLAVGRCRRCGGLVDLLTDGDGKRREPVPLPERFSIDDSDGTLVISYRSLRPMHLLALLPCVVFWFVAVDGNIRAPFFLLPGAVALGLTYYVLTGLFNRTHVEAGAVLRI